MAPISGVSPENSGFQAFLRDRQRRAEALLMRGTAAIAVEDARGAVDCVACLP